jgi:threonine/homoserine/homoserine lactone efflux protein
MYDAILQGVFLGIVLSIFVGPIFFLLIKTSVHHGVKAALILDAGIIFSDLCCIVLSYFGLAQLMQNPDYSFIFRIIGGIMLVAYGTYTLLAKDKQQDAPVIKGITKGHGIKLFVKGFVINTSVPSVLFFWIGTVTLALGQFENQQTKTILYLSSVVVTYVSFDILKIYLASKAKKLFTGNKQQSIKKVAGIALIIFGLFIMYKAIAN